uniref:Uncharacterized protein n=2 Tax=Hemiselmis andersenii TaxID=464988 RepID=A0A7S0Y2J0_HEMAN
MIQMVAGRSSLDAVRMVLGMKRERGADAADTPDLDHFSSAALREFAWRRRRRSDASDTDKETAERSEDDLASEMGDILNEDEMAEAVGRDMVKDRNTALMIWLGILIDAVPESLVIGFIVAARTRNPLIFVVAVYLSNFPEALASAATMKAVGLTHVRIMTLWTATCVVTGVGAAIGAEIIPEGEVTGNFQQLVTGMEGLAAGAMLTMIAQTMLPEAIEKGGAGMGVATLCGFLSSALVGLIPMPVL